MARKTKAERKDREKELAAERADWDKQFNVPMPSHVHDLLGLGSKIGGALSLKGTALNWSGVRFDQSKDDPIERPPSLELPPKGLGANATREEEASLQAEDLRRRYSKLWKVRGGAKRIAAEEGIGVSTVYAYMARLRRT
jgi:hypothetical protein